MPKKWFKLTTWVAPRNLENMMIHAKQGWNTRLFVGDSRDQGIEKLREVGPLE